MRLGAAKALRIWGLVALLAGSVACVADVLPESQEEVDQNQEAPPPELVEIPAGAFTMGSTEAEFGHEPDELAHEVTLTRPFMMQTTEVTQAQWRARMGNNPSRFAGCDDCPVEQVNWFDALAYLNQLSSLEGLERCYVLQGCLGTPGVDLLCQEALWRGPDCQGWRLPTEAEWEFAARAGSTTDFYNGFITDAFCADRTLENIGWYCGNAREHTNPVGGKQPNAFGLFDMSGNVFEWVWDRHARYRPEAQTDPLGPDEGLPRVGRGGGWFSFATECRAARRAAEEPEHRSADFGFRAARTSPP